MNTILVVRQLEAADELAARAKRLLIAAGVDEPPTAIDDVVACAELVHAGELDLETYKESLILSFGRKAYDAGISGLSKILAILNPAAKEILLRPDIHAKRVPFVKGHEVAHKVLPWHRAIFFADNRATLSPTTNTLLEAEATAFAAELVFQNTRFEREASDYAFSLAVPLLLADQYGASYHSAIWRYVERNSESCALVMLSRPTEELGGFVYEAKYLVASEHFYQQFMPDCNPRWGFRLELQDSIRGGSVASNEFTDVSVALHDVNGQPVECKVQAWTNQWERFALVRPIPRRLWRPRVSTAVAAF